MDNTTTELVTRPLAVPPHSLDDISRPFAGDLLQRKALARRLTNYIDRLACGAVLAIDAPWGEGKSWFARHWCADLEKAGYRVGMIDAFQQDYVEDPFFLLVGEIREVCQEDKHLANRLADKAAAVAGAILPTGFKLVLNAGGKWLLGTTDVVDQVRDAADAAVEKSAEFVQEWAKQKLEAYAAEQETVRAFRAEVQKFAAAKDKPVVIFVDELDRCRPEFAVRLIERTKHFFDVPNLVFVLVMNRGQLENAICGVYGPKTDAAAYLGKFLNLSLSLPKSRNSDVGPEAMMTKYVKATLKRYGEDQSPGWFGATLPASAQLFDLSLRDIERACALRFLSDMECDGLLACLVSIRIKKPEVFNALKRGNNAGFKAFFDALEERRQMGLWGSDGPITRYLNALLALARLAAGMGGNSERESLMQERQLLFAEDFSSSDDPVLLLVRAVRSLDLEVE
ncbi:KAP family P-loop NTPase fold protein [Cupriavidus oxalaticus]|nr:P-loop NTPase fold protein [Cupriavidus oxalaticus]